MNNNSRNRILSALPETEFAQLMPLLRPVQLSAGQSLLEPEMVSPFIYFPETSVISCVASMQDGKSAEVGMIGCEGAANVMSLLGADRGAQSLSVSIGGKALRASVKDFAQGTFSGNRIEQGLMGYAAAYLGQVSQRSACAVLHRLEQRFAIWLLLLTDRLNGDVIQITHERISAHLGARRAGITVLAAELQAAGAIACSRGRVRITDRHKLEAVACECYSTLALSPPRTIH